jgi:hypothetical protein
LTNNKASIYTDLKNYSARVPVGVRYSAAKARQATKLQTSQRASKIIPIGIKHQYMSIFTNDTNETSICAALSSFRADIKE